MYIMYYNMIMYVQELTCLGMVQPVAIQAQASVGLGISVRQGPVSVTMAKHI